MRLTLFLLCIPLWLAAQVQTFVAATVIETNGDRHVGYVSYDQASLAAGCIRFKDDLRAEPRTLRHRDVREFTLTESGRVFQQIDHRFTHEASGVTIDAKRMGELLYDGVYALHRVPQSIYEQERYRSGLAPYTFYLTVGDENYPLEVKERRVTGGNISRQNRYKGMLRVFTHDWPYAERNLDKLAYSDDALIRYLDGYTNWKTPQLQAYDSRRDIRRKKVRHGPKAFVLGLPLGEDNSLWRAGGGLGYQVEFFVPELATGLNVTVGGEVIFNAHAEPAPGDFNYVDYKTIYALPISVDYYFTHERKLKPYLRLTGAPLAVQRGGRQDVRPLVFDRLINSYRPGTVINVPFAETRFKLGAGIGAGLRVGHWNIDLGVLSGVGLRGGLSYYIQQ